MSGAATLAGLAAALVVVALAELRATRMRRGRRRSSRLLVLELLARLGRRVGVPTPGADVAARLDAAGRPFGLRPADVMAARAGGAALGLALALPLAAAMPGHLGVIVPFALALTGLLGPDLWLARRARRRARAVETELPDLLDLLRVALGAGLPLERAIDEVARRATGVLAREWGVVARQLALGVPRERALAGLARRCPVPAVTAVVRALERAARHGTPLEDALLAHAREARAAHARRLSEQAARATPKIQLVVALLLVPSVLLLIAAALLAAFAG